MWLKFTLPQNMLENEVVGADWEGDNDKLATKKGIMQI
jgi:hypothetical protein